MGQVTDSARTDSGVGRILAGRSQLRPGPRRFLWTRLAVLLATPCVLQLGSAIALSQPPKPDASQAAADSAAYLLIIDHSGSMQAKTSMGKTRWEEMQVRTVEFV